jgi:hypothetical protein
MTLEILELIKERNKVKKKGNFGKYKEIKNLITLKCRQEKDKWMKEMSEDIEQDIESGKTDKAYAKIRALQYKPRTKSNIVKDKEGKILLDEKSVSKRWKEYIEELCDGDEVEDVEGYIEKENMVDEDRKGPPISWREFESSIKFLKNLYRLKRSHYPRKVMLRSGQIIERYRSCLMLQKFCLTL